MSRQNLLDQNFELYAKYLKSFNVVTKFSAIVLKCFSVVAEPPAGRQESEEGSEDDDEEEETDEESEEDEEEDDEMEHSGTESDKAVSMPPDIIATTAPTITDEPDVSPSPPPTVSADYVITEDTPTNAVDTPTVATGEPTEPGKLKFSVQILVIAKINTH